MNLKKLLFLIFLLILPGILYLLLIGLPIYEKQIQHYILILIPLFCIYFYILWQIFRHEEKLPPLSWFLIFAGLYRLIIILSFLIIPGLYESSIFGYGFSGQTPSCIAIYLDKMPIEAMFYMGILFLFLEAVLGFLLYKLIRYFGINYYRLLIVLLNPLWIIEIYLNGHVQFIAILILWLAIYLFYIKKDLPALLVTLLSFFLTMIPLLTYLPFLYKKFWTKLFLVLASVVLIIFFFSSAAGMMPSYHFILKPTRQAFNGVLISIGIYLLNYFGFSGQETITVNWFGTPIAIYNQAEFFMLLLIIVIVLVLIISQMKKLQFTANFRSINYLQSSFIITGALLLVSPVIHPWYLLWILPFIIYLPNWSWLVFTALIQFYYFICTDYPPSDNLIASGWILFIVQYVPFYILLITEYLDKRRIKGWF